MRVKTRVVLDMSTWEVLEEEGFDYFGPVAEMKGGGETTTNTVSEPPEWQIPYLQGVLEQAKGLYDQGGPTYYPGSTVAGFNPLLQQSVASTAGAGVVAKGQADQTNMALSGLYRAQNPLNNPFFHGTADAMIRPATEQLTQQVLPQIGDQFAQAGQFGSSRQGVAEGSAINNYQRNVLDTLNQFGTNAYGQGLDALARGVTLAPQVQAMQAVPGQLFGQAGDVQRTYEQQLLDAARAKFDYEQAQPYENLQYYAGLVGNPLGTNATTVGPGQKSGGVAGAIGGGLTGAMLGAAVPGFGGALGGMGAGAALLGPAGWAGLAAGAILGYMG